MKKKTFKKIWVFKKWGRKNTEAILNSCFEAKIIFKSGKPLLYKRANMIVGCNTDCFDLYPYSKKEEDQDCYCNFYKDIMEIAVIR